jgi:hypothetical protein
MSKHTPEPWIICETATHVTVIGANNERIFHDYKRLPRVKGDALLIAAAPELLKTLSTLLAMCERQTDFNDDGDGLMLERARVLLAKVKGKA